MHELRKNKKIKERKKNVNRYVIFFSIVSQDMAKA